MPYYIFVANRKNYLWTSTRLFQNIRFRNSLVSGYSKDTIRLELANIVANAKLPMARRYSPRIGTCMPVYIENDTPPLSYSADISDMFLVSFVSMMEHGCQFRDRRIPWRSSGGCPIEFPFSGQHALQRIPLFTYLAVISPSHLPATDAAASSMALATDRLFLWQLDMIFLPESWNI